MMSLAFTALVLIASNQQPTTPVEPRFVAERMYQLKELKTTKISIPEKMELTAWIMDTNSKRAEGMMHLLDADFTEKQGMLFVFNRAAYQRFWMRNTLVDLDIAYIHANGKINSIYTMKALDETTDYSSAAASLYVLEAKAGLFKKLGVKVGDTISIPKDVKAAE
ncbi:MAG: DUF192 domain-containing protein [Armatimonadetes bacterium]|nr:DUF192 domain-containing protein [Armatimonadota bacterium]